MSDRSEIQALINEYAYRLDRGDVDGFAELFEKGEWHFDNDVGPFALRGKQEVADWLRENVFFYENGSLNTKHVTANVTIDVEDDADVASAKAYLLLFQGVPPELPLQCILSAHYEDEYVKDDGRWRFAKRTVYTDVVGEMRYHAKAWAPSDE